MKRLINYIANLFTNKQVATASAPQTIHAKRGGFEDYQLEDLVMITGLKRKKIKAIVKFYHLNYSDLLEYYLYFDRIPTKEHALIIRHFGAGHIIYTSYSSATPDQDLKKDFEFLSPAM